MKWDKLGYIFSHIYKQNLTDGMRICLFNSPKIIDLQRTIYSNSTGDFITIFQFDFQLQIATWIFFFFIII